jgi:uncharacterized membrane-anchored protein YhcB (DUF1043 family)
MASNYLWIGIAVGVFLAGIAIGYVIFIAGNSAMGNQQTMFSNMMQDPQIMDKWNQQMMNSPTGRQHMMLSMMQNQQFMNEMMNNHQFQDQTIEQMKQNHDFTQGMLMDMMDDPEIRGQMIGRMVEIKSS